MYNLALDRMENIETDEQSAYIDKNLNGDEYFKDVVGVTVSESMHPRNVTFFVDKSNAPYVKTKPLHHSQQIVEEKDDGTVFSIKVQLNYELERLLLGFGENLVLYRPLRLKKRIEQKLQKAVSNYRESESQEENQ